MISVAYTRERERERGGANLWSDLCWVMEESDWPTHSCDDEPSGHQSQAGVEQHVAHQTSLRDVAGSHGDILREKVLGSQRED